MSDEKDIFEDLAAENSDTPADGVIDGEVVEDSGDFEFEEITVTATAEDFEAAKVFSGRFVELEDNQWVPLTILQARLVKGEQEWNKGVPQILIFAEHLADTYLNGRKYPYRAWCSLVEIKAQNSDNKRRPGAKLLAATGLMPPLEEGAEATSVKITKDMVAKDVDEEGEEIIVLPGLEGKEIMGQISVKPGKMKPVLDEDGNETGEERPGFPKERLRDMVSALPDDVIDVTGKTGVRKMRVTYETIANLMAPIKAGTFVEAKLIEDSGELSEVAYRAVRTTQGTWKLVHPKMNEHPGGIEEFADTFN
ncbi:hypothetical protein [Streptomyces sp. 5-10]|uniref:hypothetical protein n=1 Tax=Streptomyces sp. 5-10 TaxID=878925 RepID=UPI00168B99B4|nr:hypothetical protein [Streptomyces sp. 5-10]MBD3004882.1 hypothetical protein [Streptomyces sp. 5-10]